MTDTRKRKPTQKETNSDGKKRRLSPSRAPPESSQAKSDDQELQGKKQDSPSKEKHPAMRSHHKKKACSVTGCKFFGSDLKRHLKLHVKRGETAEENVAQLATITTTGKKQRGKSETAYKSGKRKPGRFRKWCPVPECSSILLNVGRHLIQSHSIKKNSIQYKNLLKSVKQYTGLREISMFLEKPEQNAEETMAESGDDMDYKMAIGKLAEGRGIAGQSTQYQAVYSDNESQEGVEDESEEDKEPSEPEDQSDASFDPVASNVSAE